MTCEDDFQKHSCQKWAGWENRCGGGRGWPGIMGVFRGGRSWPGIIGVFRGGWCCR